MVLRNENSVQIGSLSTVRLLAIYVRLVAQQRPLFIPKLSHSPSVSITPKKSSRTIISVWQGPNVRYPCCVGGKNSVLLLQ